MADIFFSVFDFTFMDVMKSQYNYCIQWIGKEVISYLKKPTSHLFVDHFCEVGTLVLEQCDKFSVGITFFLVVHISTIVWALD